MILPSPGRCSSGAPTTLSQLFCDASCKLAVSEFCLLYTQEASKIRNEFQILLSCLHCSDVHNNLHRDKLQHC
jgi:hypothetical protein